MDKLPITKAGEQELTQKLRQLKTKARPEISQAIEIPREPSSYAAVRSQPQICRARNSFITVAT